MNKKEKTKKRKGTLLGRWSSSEHDRFLKGFDIYGRDWVSVQRIVKTRNLIQVRSHAQKMLAKILDDEMEQNSLFSGSNMIEYNDHSSGKTSHIESELISKGIYKTQVAHSSDKKENLLQYFAKALHQEQKIPNESHFSSQFIAQNQNYQNLSSQIKTQMILPSQKKLEQYVEAWPTLFMHAILTQKSHFQKGGNFLQLTQQ